MNRDPLIALLDAHRPEDDKERADLDEMKKAARSLEHPFSPKQPEAHFTGSALVVDPQGNRACLVHHGKLNRWLQPGGHADEADDHSIEATALRETREETNLQIYLHPTAPRPLDVDIHRIPARKSDPEHRHLDIRFLVVAEDPESLAYDPEESHGARWMSWDEALALADEPALKRLLLKARRATSGAGARPGG